MRHRKRDWKLGRTSSHRRALAASLACALIRDKRIKTTLQKAKFAREAAEHMVTLGRKGTLAARRKALSVLRNTAAVSALFSEIAPAFAGRNGGYTRIVRLGPLRGDSSEMAILEWVGIAAPSRKKKKKDKKEEKSAAK